MSDAPIVLRESEHTGLASELYLEEILVAARTAYQRVLIARSKHFGRVLALNGSTQSCERDEGVYHSALVLPAMLSHPRPRRVLVVGGGEGATARDALAFRSVERVLMVDIDGELVELCKQHLPSWHRGAFDDPRLELRVDDARAVVELLEPASFDVIVHDLGDPAVEGPSRRGFTREFFAAAKRALAEGGVLGGQIGLFNEGHEPSYRRVLATLREVFAYVMPYRRYVNSWGCQWGFALASDAPLPAADDEAIATRLAELGEHRDYDLDVHRSQLALSPRERASLAEPAEPFVDE